MVERYFPQWWNDISPRWNNISSMEERLKVIPGKINVVHVLSSLIPGDKVELLNGMKLTNGNFQTRKK